MLDNANDLDSFKEYSNFVNNIPKLTYKEANELLIKDDLVSKKRLIEGNLRIVLKYVLEFYNYYKEYFYLSSSLMDCVQDGNELLVNLIYGNYKFENYNYFRFSFFHDFWCLLKRGILINTPSTYVDDYVDILKFRDEYYKKFYKEASTEIIADILDLSNSHIEILDRMFNPTIEFENYLRNCDMTVDLAINSNLIEKKLVENEVIESCFSNELFLFLLNSNLTNNQKLVIINYYGLGKNISSNCLREIGEELGVTRQAVKRTLENGKDKLKRNKEFIKFLDEWQFKL